MKSSSFLFIKVVCRTPLPFSPKTSRWSFFDGVVLAVVLLDPTAGYATMSSSTSGTHSSVLLPTLAKSSDKMLPRAGCKLVFSAKCHNTCTVCTIQCRPSIHRRKAALLRTGDNSFWFHNSHARAIGYITLSEVMVYSLSLSKQMIICCSILLLHNTLDKRLHNHCRIWWQNTKILFLKLSIQLHDLFSRVSLSSKLCNLLYCQLGMC